MRPISAPQQPSGVNKSRRVPPSRALAPVSGRQPTISVPQAIPPASAHPGALSCRRVESARPPVRPSGRSDGLPPAGLAPRSPFLGISGPVASGGERPAGALLSTGTSRPIATIAAVSAAGRRRADAPGRRLEPRPTETNGPERRRRRDAAPSPCRRRRDAAAAAAAGLPSGRRHGVTRRHRRQRPRRRPTDETQTRRQRSRTAFVSGRRPRPAERLQPARWRRAQD